MFEDIDFDFLPNDLNVLKLLLEDIDRANIEACRRLERIEQELRSLAISPLWALEGGGGNRSQAQDHLNQQAGSFEPLFKKGERVVFFQERNVYGSRRSTSREYTASEAEVLEIKGSGRDSFPFGYELARVRNNGERSAQKFGSGSCGHKESNIFTLSRELLGQTITSEQLKVLREQRDAGRAKVERDLRELNSAGSVIFQNLNAREEIDEIVVRIREASTSKLWKLRAIVDEKIGEIMTEEAKWNTTYQPGDIVLLMVEAENHEVPKKVLKKKGPHDFVKFIKVSLGDTQCREDGKITHRVHKIKVDGTPYRNSFGPYCGYEESRIIPLVKNMITEPMHISEAKILMGMIRR